ncbi:Oxoglutarate dehydrogenase (succinyl-transferring) [Sulfidibacter corallicola]|uniref:oxoglutarate dehydrogenase (succinyl-transferring) n=1 Tax=Sulfidibacter corallicola TaxID=2818388 RepID=A0A8A4TX99_SULCO|nr:2-oxoglutarate dehydrogenase E1 component [Sulfidibacter corallicola]QTD51145.1 2-oxoglutarate dehydrogenase E1 component [Sulfidibacter corallicola]
MGTTYANHSNLAYMESMYQIYLENPERLEASWRFFFDGVAFNGGLNGHQAVPAESTQSTTAHKVQRLLRAYRKWGYLYAKIDPLELSPVDRSDLALENFGFTQDDRDIQVPTLGFLKAPHAKLGELIDALERTYCGHIGVEYTHASNFERESWFQARLEHNFNQPDLGLEVKRDILRRLNAAELFEKFLHTKYVGQKRFSLEGAEALIPCLAELIESLNEFGADEVVIGMPHRGRLNVLTNIMGKTHEEIFNEFEPNFLPDGVQGGGDVKYHKGFVSDYQTRSDEKVHINLADNPSHLEAVCPVVEGLVRAHQSLRNDENRGKVVPVLIHGDASFAGQGIVSETLNMFKLEGYSTGGTVHIIVNNQIGFTTEPRDARSTRYCSDVARQILAPVFHVNGDDPEALIHAVRIAAEFRQTYHHDVVIDLVCYRRHGHNEGDEPSFTQPVMYRSIKKMPSTRGIYTKTLIDRGDVEARVARELEQDFNQHLQEALEQARSGKVSDSSPPVGDHYHDRKPTTSIDMFAPVATAVDAEWLRGIARDMAVIPEGFHVNRKVKRLLDERLTQVEAGKGIDWGNAETLAYASLLAQGIPCRLSGQDVKRGTFSHRHAVVFDTENGREHAPVQRAAAEGTRLSIFNSHLSELAVLGFEFGYALARPKSLVIWEAQFGDFSNGAQIIIDQFIVSSEVKWNRVCDLVMFLPHGYEGQGPEHSSARLERFLQMCAQNNIQVANLTEPAQLFHILRRQALRDFQKPLVLMTPKSLLRHKSCVSDLHDFSEGGFREIIGDTKNCPDARRLVLCSGKIYYDLHEERERRENAESVALARVEQLYPLAEARLDGIVAAYPKLEEVVWAQEEPRNMGAWSFMEPRLRARFPKLKVRYVGRQPAASPAVGSLYLHRQQQDALVKAAFEPFGA